MRMRASSVLFLLAVFAPQHVFATTVATGTIAIDTEWTTDGSPYVIPSPLTVSVGATLTINPGVVVKISPTPYGNSPLIINGRLVAGSASSSNEVVFTSIADDAYGGDTNDDAASTTPEQNLWSTISFDRAATSTITHARFRYGGGAGSASGLRPEQGAMMSVQATSLTISDSTLGPVPGHDFFLGASGSLNLERVRIERSYYPIRFWSSVNDPSPNLFTMHDSSIAAPIAAIIDYHAGPYTTHIENNWWGSTSGPYSASLNPGGTVNLGYQNVAFMPFNTCDTIADPMCMRPKVSSVLFLPGIEGSRLYEGTGCGKSAEEKLWEPFESAWGVLRGVGDRKVEDLLLDQSGASVCSDIYAKGGDIIDTVNGGNIYASLMNEMNGLKSDGTISDWKPVAYDWRLSLDDLLTKGTQHGANIFYEEATSTPYIEQTLRALAAGSKTGKVAIVAHSNGGLVAKALLNRLGGEASKSLVDKVIMVGVPQSGAPADVGAMLVGYKAGLYAIKGLVPIVSNAAARALTQNSPMAYHLLPSQSYFDSVMDDSAHPVARFAGDGYAKELSAYGPIIGDLTELNDFLLARDGGREKPSTNDLKSLEILNPTLVDYANNTHAALDSWTPPSGIEVTQIAGWGVDTVGGVDFYTAQPTAVVTAFDPYRTYRPIMIEDGDGTVPVPSALMMAENTDVKRYWVNLDKFNREQSVTRKHPDLFEILSLRDFIKNIITSSTSTLPSYISSIQPPPIIENRKLTFFLHSPLTLQITDSSGNVTGIAEDGSMDQSIPDSSYGEFGEVKYISVPQGGSYELTMHGQASGTFSLDIQESSGGVVTASSTITNIPTTASTLATLTISGGIDTASPLTVDENGDGANVFTLAPIVGGTVSYEPPAPGPIVSRGGGGAWSSAPTVAPVAATTGITTTPPMTTEEVEMVASSTPIIATSAPVAISVPAKTLQVERKTAVASVVQQKKANVSVVQTASVYNASQQPALKRVGDAVYYGLHRMWRGLKVIFSIQK